MLTRRELKRLDVIRGASEKSYQLTSYDLRLGSCHYVFDNSLPQNVQQDSAKWRLFHIGSDAELQRLNCEEMGSQKYEVPKTARHTLIIPPYGSAIIELKETVDTYTAADRYNLLIVGRFDLKLSKVYRALISQQATQVEPFYTGKLYCFIHNLSGNAIPIEEGETIATIEFSYAGERLSPAQRRRLIRENKDREIEKYAESLYAGKEKRGINEVRWFYEQQRLPSDCGLNGLHTKVERDVKEAAERFDQRFDEFFTRDATLKKITDRVHADVQARQRPLEFLASAVAAVLSLGLGSVIWIFYQELAKVMARQELFNTYLSGRRAAREMSKIESKSMPCTWIPLYFVFILLAAVIFFLIYKYYMRSRKKVNEVTEKAEKAKKDLCEFERKLKDEVNGLQALREECEKLRQRQEGLEQSCSALSAAMEAQEPEAENEVR